MQRRNSGGGIRRMCVSTAGGARARRMDLNDAALAVAKIRVCELILGTPTGAYQKFAAPACRCHPAENAMKWRNINAAGVRLHPADWVLALRKLGRSLRSHTLAAISPRPLTFRLRHARRSQWRNPPLQSHDGPIPWPYSPMGRAQ
jgi:hypothetical protein